MKLNKETRKQLLEVFKEKRISLEGNILKIIDADGDQEFQDYINQSIEKDKENRRKRLDITRQVQTQNNELVKWKEENEKIQEELRLSLTQSEQAMIEAQRLKDHAKQQAEQQLLKAQGRIEKEVVDAALKRARTLLVEKINVQDQQRLNQEYVVSLEKLPQSQA